MQGEICRSYFKQNVALCFSHVKNICPQFVGFFFGGGGNFQLDCITLLVRFESSLFYIIFPDVLRYCCFF
jgi:hypothetical protein